MAVKEKEKLDTERLTAEEEVHILILFNDDFHTFDFVIETLVAVCEHEWEQAEQCAWLVHTKGKCDVKHGSYDTLKPMHTALIDSGLIAVIE